MPLSDLFMKPLTGGELFYQDMLLSTRFLLLHGLALGRAGQGRVKAGALCPVGGGMIKQTDCVWTKWEFWQSNNTQFFSAVCF